MRFRFVFAFLVLSVCAACTTAEPAVPRYGCVSQIRQKEIETTGKLYCLYPAEKADYGSVPETPEIRSLWEKISGAGLELVFRVVPADEIVPLLRSGKGDIAAGDFTGHDAVRRYTGACTVESGCTYLIRRDDSFAAGLLE